MIMVCAYVYVCIGAHVFGKSERWKSPAEFVMIHIDSQVMRRTLT